MKFEEQRKEDEKRKEQIKKEQKAAPIAQGGSVKDRRQALLERVSIEIGVTWMMNMTLIGQITLDSSQVGEKMNK